MPVTQHKVETWAWSIAHVVMKHLQVALTSDAVKISTMRLPTSNPPKGYHVQWSVLISEARRHVGSPAAAVTLTIVTLE